MVDDGISAEDKGNICAHLALLAPPLEFAEVVDDVRCLAGSDPIIQKKLNSVTIQHDRDQMIPVELPDSQFCTLLTVHGDLGGGYFHCPRTHKKFHYDHLGRTVSDITDYVSDTLLENWRHAFEAAITDYTLEHFPGGCASVYAVKKEEENLLIACISSQFCKHQSTGRWRSEWTVQVPETSSSDSFLVHGILKVQTHIYEDGNVQLISSKEVDFTVAATNKCTEFAEECVRQIRDAECNYQLAVGENFKTMSDSTFKVLRRPLPPTKSKVAWEKIITYHIGAELSRAVS